MLRAVEVSARVQGSREELYEILADVGRYAAWVPGVERSSVLAREGDVAIAELRGRRSSVRTFNLELIHSPPGVIEFHQIDSLDRPEISGRWQLEDTDRGVSPTTPVRLQVRVETPVLAFGSGRRARSALRAGLDALAARRRHLASARPDRRQKVLEVSRQADGLKVWYLGQTFVMPRARR